MEEVQEQKFVCKFCSKSCLSGKSLGGHMRCHLDLIAAAKKNKLKTDSSMGFADGGDDHGDCGLQENPKNTCKATAEQQSNSGLVQEKVEDFSINLGNDDQDSYGLRENPKKSWKISDSRNRRTPRKANLCKECCKRFPSSRALAGHMRTHSNKGKDRHLCKKCDKGFDSMRALFGHMKSHSKRSRVSTEPADGVSEFEMDYPRKKRSVIRYKISQNLSFSSANASSSADETEVVEEAAKCLMMLSRGVKNWDESNSPLESTDNDNSAVFESKAFPYRKEMNKIAADDFVCDADEIDNMESPRENLDPASSASEMKVSEFNDLDSEFLIGNEKKAELEVSVVELLHSDKSKESRQVDGSAVRLVDNKILRASDSSDLEQAKDLVMEVGTDQDDTKAADADPCKKASSVAPDPELGGNFSDMVKDAHTVSEILKDYEKKREYKCRTCDKIFHSHQALGGHRNRHKIISGSAALITETSFLSDNENNGTPIEPGIAGMAMTAFDSAKSKEHECPICFKVFPTGQALGGHKRAHYVGLTESRTKDITVDNQELHDIQNIFDLNVPVISHHETRDDDVMLKLWRAGCGHERELLVITN